MLVFSSPYYWTLQTRISPIPVHIHFLLLLFFSHRMLNSWPCQQHNSPNTILVSRPLQFQLFFSRQNTTQALTLCLRSSSLPSLDLHCGSPLNLLLEAMLTIAPSHKKCTEASQMRAWGSHHHPEYRWYFHIHIRGALCCVMTPAIIQAVGQFADSITSHDHKINLGKWGEVDCMLWFLLFTLWDKGPAFKRRGNQRLMGNHHLGLSQIMKCWESWPWILQGCWEQSANCQDQ